MSSVDLEPPDLKEVEAAALGRLESESGAVEAGLDQAGAESETAGDDSGQDARRRVLAVGSASLGAAVMAGGIFTGVPFPQLIAAAAVAAGVLLAYGLRRVRSLWLLAPALLVAIALIGVAAALLAGGPDAVANLTRWVQSALRQSRLLRPPVELSPGFAALLAWLGAVVGFCSAWVAIVVRRPFLGLMLPLPVAAVAAISVDPDLQVPSGVIMIALFGAGLGILAGDRDSAGTALPLAYELRRAAKAAPLLIGVTVVLLVLGETGVLFPPKLINPSLQAQKPRTEPISSVPDRVLFEVQSDVTGPWVVGVLDVYDGSDWRLPPLASSQLHDIPASGRVGPGDPALQAQFTVRGLGGAVLPTLPNTVGILATGPKLDYDGRSGNIRLVQGEVAQGYIYKVAALGLPRIEDLAGDKARPPASIQKQFTDVPAAPPAVAALIKKAPKTSQWAEFDWLRNYVLQNVTASGPGSPVAIPPGRVQQILGETKEASPFEIVALQALLARWIGLPARIGYGFDGGTKVGDHVEVHPRNGASFPEVYFAGHGWLPVIAPPARAKVSNDSGQQQQLQGVLPSQDIAVTLYLPVPLPGAPLLYQTILQIALIVIAVLAVLGLIYLLLPLAQKAVHRQRRRAAAVRAGPRGRIVEAYCEWRDLLTDYGYEFASDTPLMLLRRFARDEEHHQLAWLVTRALWGDLQVATDEHAADAEELSRSLRRRLGQAHPVTVRSVAMLSRLSLRHPYEGREAVAPPSQSEVIQHAAI